MEQCENTVWCVQGEQAVLLMATKSFTLQTSNIVYIVETLLHLAQG